MALLNELASIEIGILLDQINDLTADYNLKFSVLACAMQECELDRTINSNSIGSVSLRLDYIWTFIRMRSSSRKR